MKKQLLLLAMAMGVLILGISQSSFAADNASQTVTGTLATVKRVQTNGGNITSNIDEDGALLTTFAPGFKIITNIATSQAMTLKATLTDQSGPNVVALYDNAGTRYLILANTAVGEIPPASAIADIKAGSSDPANNANAIAYAVTEPTDIPSVLDYTWNAAGYWDADLTKRGNTDTALTIPAGAAVANTYSGDDGPGDYEAIITLSFV